VAVDTDYQPARESFREPWAELRAGSGWSPGAGERDAGLTPNRVLRFDNASGEGWLRFDPDPTQGNQPLTDWLAYAATKSPGAGDSYDSRGLIARNNVSDLKLGLVYERRSGDGPLRLQLTKLGTTFTAELTPGKARLLREREGGLQREIGSAALTG